jgi:hypothetical protein
LANLGEKKFAVFLYADGRELYDELLEKYPRLHHGGGYELLRVAGEKGGKRLEVVSVPANGYSVQYLKAVVSSAKLYIRPLQRDLDLSECVNMVSFECLLVLCN